MRFPRPGPVQGRRLILILLLALAPVLAADPGGTSPRINAPGQEDKPSLVLVSIDGFRWDFAERFGAPHIASIGTRGLQADALQPAFPTLTFPNHFSIATGLPPARHGIVANRFPDEDRKRWYDYKDSAYVQDGSWYLADPIWVIAERAGMRTAAFYFVGSEADISGIRPTRWNAFDANVSGNERVRQVLDWLAEPPQTRPKLITLYFEEVDDETHRYGVGSPESLAAVHSVDGHIGRLLDGVQALPHGSEVYVFLVSDHGTAGYRPEPQPLVLDRVVDLSGIHIEEGGPYAWLYFEPGDAGRAESVRDAINAQWDCGRALLPADTPASWQVSTSQRFPDLFVQADPGCGVISTASMRHKIEAADHGWVPDFPDMRGVFYAMGPRIRPGTRPGVMKVTDVFPLMLSVLGLPAHEGGSPATTPSGTSALLMPPGTH